MGAQTGAGLKAVHIQGIGSLMDAGRADRPCQLDSVIVQ